MDGSQCVDVIPGRAVAYLFLAAVLVPGHLIFVALRVNGRKKAVNPLLWEDSIMVFATVSIHAAMLFFSIVHILMKPFQLVALPFEALRLDWYHYGLTRDAQCLPKSRASRFEWLFLFSMLLYSLSVAASRVAVALLLVRIANLPRKFNSGLVALATFHGLVLTITAIWSTAACLPSRREVVFHPKCRPWKAVSFMSHFSTGA